MPAQSSQHPTAVGTYDMNVPILTAAPVTVDNVVMEASNFPSAEIEVTREMCDRARGVKIGGAKLNLTDEYSAAIYRAMATTPVAPGKSRSMP